VPLHDPAGFSSTATLNAQATASVPLITTVS
jgi:hypothetical protein